MKQATIRELMASRSALKTIDGLRAYRWALIIVALLGTVLISAAVRAYNRPESSSMIPAPSFSPLSSTQPSQSSDRLEAEVVTIRATGFEPQQIKRPAGRFLLAVDNRCGLAEVRLRFDRENGVRIQQANVGWDKLDWRQLIDVPPGTYLLTEENHPEWFCRITVGLP